MAIKIRRATIDDLAAIQKLNYDLFVSDDGWNHDLNTKWPYEKEGEDYFRACITNENGNFLSMVAEEGHEIVGYLNARIRKPHSAYVGVRAEIENMCVAEGYRSHGVGTQLIDQFKIWSKDMKADHIVVEAFAANERAIKFYEKNGFTPYTTTLWQKR